MGALRLVLAALAAACLCALCAGSALAATHRHHRSHRHSRCSRAARYRASHAPVRARRHTGHCPRRPARRHAFQQRPRAGGARGGATPSHSFHGGQPPAHSTAADCAGAGLSPTPWNIPTIRAAVLCLVNRERAAHGEQALQANGQLEQAAQRHSESMAFDGYFEHVGPDGDTPLDRMRAAGYIYSSGVGYEIGENIAWGSGSLATPRAIVAAWMASPEHRANILEARYRDSAIGVSPHLPSSLGHGQPGGIYTQDFGVILGA